MPLTRRALLALCSLAIAAGLSGHAQVPKEPFQPEVGQAGKDVIWVPTAQVMVERMLDMAKVTSRDFVVDLGSGDGRMVIAAGKRGARALGVEFNPDMVDLSKRNAVMAGVSRRVNFVQGDMFEADFSRATVLALFLLPDNLRKFSQKFLNLKPGTRIVTNTFGIEGWEPDESESMNDEDCQTWCKPLLFVVPARVDGAWRMSGGALALKQDFQMLSGTLTSGTVVAPISNARLRGAEIVFRVGDAEYTGLVNGNGMKGTLKSGGRESKWNASRVNR